MLVVPLGPLWLMLFVDLQEVGNYLLMPLPGQDTLHGKLDLGVASGEVAQLRIGVLRNRDDELGNHDRIGLAKLLDSLAHSNTPFDVGRRLFRGLLSHDRAPRPDAGLKCSRLNQHYFDAERVQFHAQRFAPSFQGVFRRRVAAHGDRPVQSGDQ